MISLCTDNRWTSEALLMLIMAFVRRTKHNGDVVVWQKDLYRMYHIFYVNGLYLSLFSSSTYPNSHLAMKSAIRNIQTVQILTTYVPILAPYTTINISKIYSTKSEIYFKTPKTENIFRNRKHFKNPKKFKKPNIYFSALIHLWNLV